MEIQNAFLGCLDFSLPTLDYFACTDYHSVSLRFFGEKCSTQSEEPLSQIVLCLIYPLVGGKLLWHWEDLTQSFDSLVRRQ